MLCFVLCCICLNIFLKNTSLIVFNPTFVNDEITNLRQDLGDLEFTLAKCEKDKISLNNKNKSLREELNNNEETIEKMTKEKKEIVHNHQLTLDELQV